MVRLKLLKKQNSSMYNMGLRLTSQIAKAHGGELVFVKRESGTYDAEFRIKRLLNE